MPLTRVSADAILDKSSGQSIGEIFSSWSIRPLKALLG